MTAIRKVVLYITHCQCIIDLTTDCSSSVGRLGIKLPLNKDVYTQTMLMARHQRIAKLFDEEFGVTR